MKISIRKRKLKDGKEYSLFLEFYIGYNKTPDGKIKHIRDYESLGLQIYCNPKTQSQKTENKNNLELAEAIRVKRLNEYNTGKHGFAKKKNTNQRFLEFFEKLAEEKNTSRGNYSNWRSTLLHLRRYCKKNITFNEINADFIIGFREYLDRDAQTKSMIPLASNSKHSYFNKFRVAINKAYDTNLLHDNPLRGITGIKQETPQREYLTEDEIQRLFNSECKYPQLKKAFLFSCLSGMRWSDVVSITWAEVRDGEDESEIYFRQQKTKGLNHLPITSQARTMLGERANETDRVFVGLKYGSTFNKALQDWCYAQGIYKKVTFHVARHSHSVNLLNNGVDIYDVKELLGHSNIQTTLLYSQMTNMKAKKAIQSFPKFKI